MENNDLNPVEELKWEAKSLLIIGLVLLAILGISVSGCKHDIPVPINANDDDNGGGGGGGGSGQPCDPNTVYFQQQVLPFLVSSCAKSGCHNAATAEDGVILDSYANVMNTGEVTPFDLSDSEIWEVINESDPDKRMPPAGETQLTQAQINMLALWINQGAQNLTCDDANGPCDSVSVSFAGDVTPILQNKCVGCHTTATSTNGFVSLSGFTNVESVALTGQLVGAITHDPSYAAMPDGGPKLNACEIAKIKNWVSEGTLNN